MSNDKKETEGKLKQPQPTQKISDYTSINDNRIYESDINSEDSNTDSESDETQDND